MLEEQEYTTSQEKQSIFTEKLLRYSGILALLVALILFLSKAISGLTLFEFGDETEKFVAAQMMKQGLHLYKDIYANHGLLPFLFVQIYTYLVSSTDFSYVRLINVIIALVATFSLFTSPVLKNLKDKLWASATFLALLSSVWVVQGLHFVYYHSIGGLLFVIPLMQMALPALINGKVTKRGAFISGFAITLMCFASYSFGISALLLVISTLIVINLNEIETRKAILQFGLGTIIAAGLMVIWLLLFGDIVGYLVYHFYINQKYYPNYAAVSLINIFDNFELSFKPNRIVKSLALLQLLAWVFLGYFIISSHRNRLYARRIIGLILLAISMLMLNFRGTYLFHNAGYVINNIACFAVFSTLIIAKFKSSYKLTGLVSLVLVTVLSVIFINNNAISTPHRVSVPDLNKFQVKLKPSNETPYQFVRDITERDDRVQSLIFNQAFYMNANRLPASGHTYYLPWQADYQRNPFPGFDIDICHDLLTVQPKVIWFDNWKVWGQYLVGEYEPCVLDIILSDYTLVLPNLYVLNELADTLGLDVMTNYKMHEHSFIIGDESMELAMTGKYLADPRPLSKVGILFSTAESTLPATKQLNFIRQDGGIHQASVERSDLKNNRYHFFDLPSGNYVSMTINTITGQGISLWESHKDTGEKYTCLIYEFENGEKLFTPGCTLLY